MNAQRGVAGFLLLVLLSLAALAGEETGMVHIVQRGETIYSIARAYGVDQNELMRLNGIADPTKLKVGQRLSIPGQAAAAEGETGTVEEEIFHEAAWGDTFYSIARKYGVTLEALLEANSLTTDYVLKEKDVLRIPRKGASASSSSSTSSRTTGTGTGASTPTSTAPPGTGASTGTTPGAAAGTSAAAAASGTATTSAATPAGGAAASGGTAQSAAVTPALAAVAETARATEKGTLDASVRWPVVARDLSYMTGKLTGVVITGEKTEAVKSLTEGTVISAGPYRGFGRVVIVQMTGGYLYVYGGCESLSVKEGDKVVGGTELGKLGLDAVSGKPQLFFMVYRSNTPIDPAKAPRSS